MIDTFITVFGSFNVWTYVLIGTLWGLIIGALPGVGSSFAMVIALPFTYGMSIDHSIVLLISIYTSAIYGGSISACLLCIPGTGGNVVTTFDGYQMTKQGKAGLALGTSAIGSEIGNIVGAGILIFIGPKFVDFALNFGPHEMFAVGLWAFIMSFAIAPGNLGKNWIAGVVGLVLAVIGMDNKYGIPRLTFGSTYLIGGVNLIPAILGIFGVTIVLQSIFEGDDLTHTVKQKSLKMSGFKGLKSPWIWVVIMGSSLIGFLIGVVPAAGSLVAALIAYGVFKKLSPHGHEYGKGSYEGIMIAETTNNACHPGDILTTLVLGVPGEMAMVVLLGAFMLHGLNCGPLLLVKHPEYLQNVFLTIMISGALTFIIAWTTMIGWVKAIECPKMYIWPIVVLLCIIGAYSLNNSINDVMVMLGTGVLAFFGEKYGYSKIPLMMGLVLGPIMEDNLRNALLMDAPMAFFTKPIAMALLVITIGTAIAFIWLLNPQKDETEKGS